MRRSRRNVNTSLLDLYRSNEESILNNWMSLFFFLFTFLSSLIGIGGKYAALSWIVAIISGVLIFYITREISRGRKLKKSLLQENDGKSL
jgi:hypothetical protein